MSRLLTEAEAIARCRYDARGCKDPARAFRKWATRAGVPFKRIARKRLYDEQVLLAFIEGRAWTKRHAYPRSA